MNFLHRRIPPPDASKKRKEREPFYHPAPLPNHWVTTSPKPKPRPGSVVKPPALAEDKGKKSPDDPQPIDNRILAGYMAHEFLTRGTILGQGFDPGRAEAAGEPSQRKGKEEEEGRRKQEHTSYADVAGMLWKDGVHIPGVVNPGQLLTWLRQS